MRTKRRLRWVALPVAGAVAIALAGCSPAQLRGYLPGEAGVTNHTDSVVGLWTTSWIVLLLVGVLTWGLILWASVVYRRRRGQTGLPVQMRYNLPIEIFYTVVPLILILGFFAFTARDQAEIETPIANPDVSIEAIGKRWAWDFNYVKEDVYSTGIQAQENAKNEIDQSTLPTLYLPVDAKVEIKVEARDVAHSFFVVDFLYKKDMLPGRSNYMYFVPEKIGSYRGKCAELCGEYHSLMLFNVEVVSQEDYDAYIASRRVDGFEGQQGLDFNVNQNLPGNTGESTKGAE